MERMLAFLCRTNGPALTTLRVGGSGLPLRGMLASYGVTGVHFNSGKWIHEYLIYYSLYISMGFPGGLDGKESICDARNLGLIPGLGRSPGEGRSLGEVLLEGKCHGQRSLVGYIVHGVIKSLA